MRGCRRYSSVAPQEGSTRLSAFQMEERVVKDIRVRAAYARSAMKFNSYSAVGGTGVTVKALEMVTDAEMEALCDALHQDHLPADLQAKLNRLRVDDPRELYLKHQSLLLSSLLMSPAAREFCLVRPRVCERLLRMLAYVRKDDDAIPDTWPGGMADDHDLMRLTCSELREVLATFKAWHLSRRVPSLWIANAAPVRGFSPK